MFAKLLTTLLVVQLALSRPLIDAGGLGDGSAVGLQARADGPPRIWLALGPGVTVHNFKEGTDPTIKGADFTGPGIKGAIGLGMNPVMGWDISFKRGEKTVKEQCHVIKDDRKLAQLDDRVFVIQAQEDGGFPIKTNGPLTFFCGPPGFVAVVPT